VLVSFDVRYPTNNLLVLIKIHRPVCLSDRYSLAAHCLVEEQSGLELCTIQVPTKQYPTDACG
jgi:hypothetical protein